MKHLINFYVFVCFMCICPSIVFASNCSKDVSRDLTKEAYYIKSNYEIIDNSTYKEIKIGEDKTTFKIPRYEFNISIYNITKNLYVIIKNDVDSSVKTIHYSDTVDGTYSFLDTNFGQIYKYVMEIYPEANDCANKKLKTIKLVRPMYNAYSEYAYCKHSSNYYCQKFTKNKLNLKGNKDFLSKIKVNNDRRSEEIKKETKKETEKSLIEIIIDNWQMYLGIFTGSIIVSIVLLVLIRKRRNKKEWDK